MILVRASEETAGAFHNSVNCGFAQSKQPADLTETVATRAQF
jgi:Zn ribbon nucleic-acid-binding protein